VNKPDEFGRAESVGYYRRMQAAVEELLILKGVVTAADVDRQVAAMAERSYERGARVVARAWVDPAYKARLLADGAAAAEELGLEVGPLRLVVVENTPEVHNVVVCTLCSCYPRMLLGIPPEWYKSRAYRSRTVREPRAVLAEFGTQLAPGVRIRVHDSTADMRYMVLPLRPAGTDGWSEERLAALVTRDALIGVAQVPDPAALPRPGGRAIETGFPRRRNAMPDTIRKLDYFAAQVADKPGEGARILQALRDEGVNLLAFSGFPSGKKTQVDFVPESPEALKAAAKKLKLKLGARKHCFVIQGDDRVGALTDTLVRLADAKVNVTASQAVTAGMGRFGAIFWVKARDVNKVAKLLGAG
jgi:nitrile hydratase